MKPFTDVGQHLYLVQPMRLFRSHQHRHEDGHILAMRRPRDKGAAAHHLEVLCGE
jgi:hypothetical protein